MGNVLARLTNNQQMAGPFDHLQDIQQEVVGEVDPSSDAFEVAEDDEHEEHTLVLECSASAATNTHLRSLLPPNPSTPWLTHQVNYPFWPSGPSLTTSPAAPKEVLTARAAVCKLQNPSGLREMTRRVLCDSFACEEMQDYDANRALVLGSASRRMLRARSWLDGRARRRAVRERMEREEVVRAAVEAQRRAERLLREMSAMGEGRADEDEGSPMSFRCVGLAGERVDRAGDEEPEGVAGSFVSAVFSSVSLPGHLLQTALPKACSAPPFRILRASPYAYGSVPLDHYFRLPGKEVRRPLQQGRVGVDEYFEVSTSASVSETQSWEGTGSSYSSYLSGCSSDTGGEQIDQYFAKVPIPKPNLQSALMPAIMFLQYDHGHRVGLAAEQQAASPIAGEDAGPTDFPGPTPEPRRTRLVRADTPYPGARRLLRHADAVADIRQVVRQHPMGRIPASPIQSRGVNFDRQQQSRIVNSDERAICIDPRVIPISCYRSRAGVIAEVPNLEASA